MISGRRYQVTLKEPVYCPRVGASATCTLATYIVWGECTQIQDNTLFLGTFETSISNIVASIETDTPHIDAFKAI